MSIPAVPNEEEVFSHALGLPEAARATYLAAACGGDAALRARIEALLRASEAAHHFMEAPVMPPSVSRPGDAAVGDRIGRYKLLQQIGEGGCGVVYMAGQEEPVRRRVALKVIKLGMDTKEVIARFEAERQALALMDHPNIARVFDGGATDTGRPYFVMELVRGVPITKFCDEQNFSTAKRLELFTAVCHAVQHAHQKGIIHRDLKPSNILVTVNDAAPVPKVIDFGIAKATQGRLTDQTLFTAFEQFIGTPAYMSPEQAEMTSLDVDTRSDIYSLGVLLYELLTGRAPFDPKTLVAAGLDEIRRIIREVEPPRPSTRLNTLTDLDRATIAKQRDILPGQLSSLLRGDLDWIVMRCLEKDRTRRYETANGLAMDLQRHLRDEPVVARPPGAAYLLQKLILRHRIAVAAGAAIVAILGVGIVTSTWQAVRATRAEQLAAGRLLAEQAARWESERQRTAADIERARAQTAGKLAVDRADAEQRARRDADAQKVIAEQESLSARTAEQNAQSAAKKSEQVARFLQDMLASVGPSVALGRDTKLLREVLDRTVERVGRDLADQPIIAAELLSMLGNVSVELGELATAEAVGRNALAFRQRAFGTDHPEIARSLNDIADVLRQDGKFAEAEAMHRQALAMRRTLLGNDHPDVAASLSNLGESLRRQIPAKRTEAEMLHREALAIRRKVFDDQHWSVAASLGRLALVLNGQGRLAEAEALEREALAITRANAEDHPAVATSLNRMSLVVRSQGRLAEAEALSRESLAISRKMLGEHPAVAGSLASVGWLLEQQDKLGEAEPILREAVTLRRKLLDVGHPDLADSLQNLGRVLSRRGQHQEGETFVREALAIRRKLGVDEVFARCLIGFGGLLKAQSKWDEAAAVYDEALAIFRQQHGTEHLEVARCLIQIGGVFERQSRPDDAAAAYQEALAMQRKLLGDEHLEVAGTLERVGVTWSARKKPAEAETALREALAIRRKLQGDSHADVATTLRTLATVLPRPARQAEATQLYEQAHAIRKRVLGPDHRDTMSSLSNLAGAYRAEGKFSDAIALQIQVLETRKRVLGLEHADTLAAMMDLANSYRSQGHHGDAGVLYQQVLDTQKRVIGADHPETVAAMSTLASSHRSAGKRPEAEAMHEQILEIQARTLGPEHPGTLAAMHNLAVAHHALRRTSAADRLYVDTLELQKRILGFEHPALLTTLSHFARLMLELNRFSEAESLVHQALKGRARTGLSGWETAFDTWQLGEALIGLNRFVEAEPLLKSGYERLCQEIDSLPGDARAAFRASQTRLLQLFKAVGRSDLSELWRETIAEFARAEAAKRVHREERKK